MQPPNVCYSSYRAVKSTTRLFGASMETEQSASSPAFLSDPNTSLSHNGHQVAAAVANATHNGSVPTAINVQKQEEVPLPTENGGFSHTSASKAKISAANKGKTPWNKGRKRSEEERAKIAAGVRAKNRERFLQKLKDLGVTEEEYQQQKKEERRRKDAERRARKTENGGYRPTEETKQKISAVLKEKWANGEIKRRKVDPTKVRRGFSHSEETRAKISQSLRKRWADDEEYRTNMMKKSSEINGQQHVKERISKALKKKWEDPEFRQQMMEKMATRKRNNSSHDGSHRQKISEAMKAKWEDPEYRKKAMEAIQRRQAASPRPKKKVVKKAPKKSRVRGVKAAKVVKEPKVATAKLDEYRMAQPVQANAKNVVKKRKTKAKKQVIVDTDGSATAVVKKRKKRKASVVKGERPEKKEAKKVKEPDGSINRLREERRDLYDLLYGEEPAAAELQLDDENLDTFDPYGLDDF